MRPFARPIPGVRDSKTLSAAQREALAPLIRGRALAVGVGAASVAEIDRLNIYHATHLAMSRALARVGDHDHVLVDGHRIAGFEREVGPYEAIVDGDALVYSIACASIVAKVVRDRMMARLAARYPGYGWERNAGYATAEHRAAMRRSGSPRSTGARSSRRGERSRASSSSASTSSPSAPGATRAATGSRRQMPAPRGTWRPTRKSPCSRRYGRR